MSKHRLQRGSEAATEDQGVRALSRIGINSELPQSCRDLYAAKRYNRLSNLLLTSFNSLGQFLIFNSSQKQIDILEGFISTFLQLFVQQDYIIDKNYATQFITINPLISNLVAITKLGNTDAYVQQLQPHNVLKFLTLVSPRNSVEIDYNELLNISPAATNYWYSIYFLNYQSSISNADSWTNLKRHVAVASNPKLRSQLTQLQHENTVHYGVTYIDEENDRFLKKRINEIIQSRLTFSPNISQIPTGTGRIAVISDAWTSQHSVYRNFSQYVEALSGKFDLTLVTRLRKAGVKPDFNQTVFSNVIWLQHGGTFKNQVQQLCDADFDAVFFADVGMSEMSIILANTRIAPVQIAGVGHSVSGYGTKVDYFISGEDTEKKDQPESNYFERLVMLPGFGVIHNQPLYEPTTDNKNESDRLIINCSWTSQKLNAALLNALKTIVDSVDRKIVFQIFAGAGLLRYNNYSPFQKEAEKILGKENVYVSPPLPYNEYMAAIEKSDLALDAFHFGGCNTIADCLFLNKPVITWEGSKWYNRIGSAMLISAGLEELVARNEQEYIDTAVRLIQDDNWREELSLKIAATDLNGNVFSGDAAPWFRDSVEYLINNHETLSADSSRSALRMSNLLRQSIVSG